VRVALSATDEDLGAGVEAEVPEKGQSAMVEVPLEAERELGGLITLEGGTVCRLSEQQALPQGSQLRNTDWATGLVVYSGNETRLGRSRRVPGAKRAQTDYAIDRLSAIVFVVQAAIALVLGTMGNAWSNELGIDAWYLGLTRAEDERGIVADTYEMSVIPLRFLLLMSTMIPLSMQVMSPSSVPHAPCMAPAPRCRGLSRLTEPALY
jgi:magnesium-transporting ATPase (P-type)